MTFGDMLSTVFLRPSTATTEPRSHLRDCLGFKRKIRALLLVVDGSFDFTLRLQSGDDVLVFPSDLKQNFKLPSYQVTKSCKMSPALFKMVCASDGLSMFAGPTVFAEHTEGHRIDSTSPSKQSRMFNLEKWLGLGIS